MRDATFTDPDLTTFTRLDGHGLQVVGQRLEPDRAVLACKVAEPDPWCRRCGAQGVVRGTVVRELAHEPLGWRPTIVQVRVPRYRCEGCAHVWRQDISTAAEPRAKLTRGALRWVSVTGCWHCPGRRGAGSTTSATTVRRFLSRRAPIAWRGGASGAPPG